MSAPTRNSDDPWVFLDHTADIRMEVRGETLEELFVNAARGLTEVLAPGAPASGDLKRRVVLYAVDSEDLLVNWLREILYLSEAEDVTLTDASIVELEPDRLDAVIEVLRGIPQRQAADVEIKAVTHHGLSIERDERGFTAGIVFDI